MYVKKECEKCKELIEWEIELHEYFKIDPVVPFVQFVKLCPNCRQTYLINFGVVSIEKKW